MLLFWDTHLKLTMQWGKIFMKRHLHFGFKDLVFFSFFFQYPKIEYILNFKIDICDFKKASIPLYIESTSALLKRNEDKAYHYIAKKQKWNYGTIYFSRQLTFKFYLLIWEANLIFKLKEIDDQTITTIYRSKTAGKYFTSK